VSRRHPNLVFVWADQLRYHALGYAGDDKARTPALDEFAARSVNFVNAVANTPVCAAWRSSFLTGTYATTTGMVINELRMHPGQPCFGHALTRAGYETAYIGKWHLYANEFGGHDKPRNSFVPPGPHRLGFDGLWAAYNFNHLNYGAHYHRDSPEQLSWGPGVYEPDAQTDLAIDFIRARAGGTAPFALFLSWGPPHDPWDDDNTPERFGLELEGVEFPHPPNYRDEDDPYGDAWAALTPGERELLPAWRRNYYAMVSSLDWNFARILQALDDEQLVGDTIVVFTSDHGELFGAHGRRAKNVFYEEAVRVPFLVRWPGELLSGARLDACLGTVDILPTLASLLELDVSPRVEGMDLSGLARGKRGPEPQAALLQGLGSVAVFEDGFEWRGLRDKQFTYAVWRRDGSEHLFDNLADPFQLHDLAADPAHRETAAALRTQLERRMAELGDTFESSLWYAYHWTDGDRRIIRGARGGFAT
jgi:arylsulfatase A-like enzyme